MHPQSATGSPLQIFEGCPDVITCAKPLWCSKNWLFACLHFMLITRTQIFCAWTCIQRSNTGHTKRSPNKTHHGPRELCRNSHRRRNCNNRRTDNSLSNDSTTCNFAQHPTAANASSAGGRGRGNHGADRNRRGRGRFSGVNRYGRCNYCRNSTEHGCDDCSLPLEHVRMDAKTENANISHSSTTSNKTTSTAWRTRTISTETVSGLAEFDTIIGAYEGEYKRIWRAPPGLC